MIFAAGLGTRLHPHTLDKPKALVEVAGKTLLERAIIRLIEAGCTEIIVNVHHFAEQIITFINQHQWEVPIHVSDERDELLDTGGGLKKAHRLLSGDEPFLIYNVDVLSNLNLNELVRYHNEKKALVTVVVRKRDTARYLVFDEEMQLSGWTNIKTGEVRMARECVNRNLFAFSGIHLVSPAIFNHIKESGKFSVIHLYLRLAATQSIFGYSDESSLWMDLGKPDQLEKANELLCSSRGSK